MYLPLAAFPVRHLGSNNPVPKKYNPVYDQDSGINDKQNQKESFSCAFYLGKVRVTGARQK